MAPGAELGLDARATAHLGMNERRAGEADSPLFYIGRLGTVIKVEALARRNESPRPRPDCCERFAALRNDPVDQVGITQHARATRVKVKVREKRQPIASAPQERYSEDRVAGPPMPGPGEQRIDGLHHIGTHTPSVHPHSWQAVQGMNPLHRELALASRPSLSVCHEADPLRGGSARRNLTGASRAGRHDVDTRATIVNPPASAGHRVTKRSTHLRIRTRHVPWRASRLVFP
jgi:hypothetical protein